MDEGSDVMRRGALAIVPAAVMAGVCLSPSTALADTVGTPGTPSCFGERISHGSSVHGLTPVERAAALQEIVDEGDPFAIELFGDTVTVQEMIKFVQANCSDDPIIPS